MTSLFAIAGRHAIVRVTKRGFFFLVFVACILLLTRSKARGQVTNVDDTTSTPIPGAGHDYIHFLSETVNPANGSVSLRIALPIPKGRGITPSFSIDYDSDTAQHVEPTTLGSAGWASNGNGGMNPDNDVLAGGWSFGVPNISYDYWEVTEGEDPNFYTCNAYSDYVFTDFSGGQHALNIGSQYSYNAGPCGGNDASQGGDPQVQAILPDSANDYYNQSASSWMPLNVYTPDGTIYTFTTGNSLPSTVEDRNGNVLTFYDSGSPDPINDNFSIVDTAGRTVISSGGWSGNGETLNVGGLTYQLTWTTVSANANVASQYIPAYYPENSPYDSCIGGFPAMQNTQHVISQITLPNGQSYTFHYGTDNANPQFQNPYGLLNEIDYPTGAWVKYTWEPIDNFNEIADYPGEYNHTCSIDGELTSCTDPAPNGCVYQYTGPVLSGREVGFNLGGTPAQTQTFTYTTSWDSNNTSWSQKKTQVQTTDPVRGSATTDYTYEPFTIPTNNPLDNGSSVLPQVPLEQTIQYYDYNGQLLETVNKSWVNQYLLASVQTAPTNSSTSEITYGYANSPFGLEDEEDEYDFGASSPTQMTHTTYQSFSGAPGDLVDKPCSVVVCSGGSSCSSSSSNRVAETDYLYDGGTSVCGASGSASTSPVAGPPLPNNPLTHDEANYSSSKTTPRGNVTEVVKKCLQNCSDSKTQYSYDETGQVASMTDPCGNPPCGDMPSGSSHTTTYSFSDSPAGGNPYGNSNAYLTQVTDPAGHQRNFSYNYSMGDLTSAEDENLQTTNYVYNTPPSGCGYPDGLDRLSEIDYPDNGKTTYCYNDSALIVTTTELQNPDPAKVSVKLMDGMGHTVQTQLTSDPDGTDYVDTSYDGEGRVYTQSNPHRSAPSPSDGTSTFYYDALGRNAATVHPDGAAETWCYNNIPSSMPTGVSETCNSHLGSSPPDTWVDYKNEKGSDWQKTSDALGDLIEVMEPGSAANPPSWETDYSYTALRDLAGVAQKGDGSGNRNRTFGYDSLSRLLCAANPENSTASCPSSGAGGAGTIEYVYDANGNLQSTTDARGVTTNYGYDNLNRLLSKSYSDITTPWACYLYDTATNGVGRLAYEWTQVASVGSCSQSFSPSSGYLTAGAIASPGAGYDRMGRLLGEAEYTPSGIAKGTSYPMTYTYDLAGNLTSSTAGAVPPSWAAASPLPSPPCTGAPSFSATMLMFVNCYGGAGRLSSVTTNAGAGPTSLFTASGYTPFGRLMNASYGGTGSGSNAVILSRTYDNRLRITSETDLGNSPSSSTNGSATVTITGVEQSQ